MTSKAALEMIESITLKWQMGVRPSTDAINDVTNVIVDWKEKQEKKIDKNMSLTFRFSIHLNSLSTNFLFLMSILL